MYFISVGFLMAKCELLNLADFPSLTKVYPIWVSNQVIPLLQHSVLNSVLTTTLNVLEYSGTLTIRVIVQCRFCIHDAFTSRGCFSIPC